MKEIRILGLHITEKVIEVVQIQHILTKYGCSIKTRLGLHDEGIEIYNGKGLILLELTGEIEEMNKLENELLKIKGLEVQKMIF